MHAVELKTIVPENERCLDITRPKIEKEVGDQHILVYGKGTKDAPRCGFTFETIEFFNGFGYPFEVIDVLENMPKREASRDDQLADLAEDLHQRQVLRRYGHPRADGQSGELQPCWPTRSAQTLPAQKQTINLH